MHAAQPAPDVGHLFTCLLSPQAADGFTANDSPGMQSAVMETPTVVIPAPEPPVIEPPLVPETPVVTPPVVEPPVTPETPETPTPQPPTTTPNVTEDPYAPGPYKFVEMTQEQQRRMYQLTSIFENADVSSLLNGLHCQVSPCQPHA